MRQILHRPDVSGRLAKWVIELGEHDISFEPRNAIKAQVLADFIAELTITGDDQDNCEKTIEEPSSKSSTWVLYTDGSSTGDSSGAGLVLQSPSGWSASVAVKFGFKATNNEAEYEAMVAGLQLARGLGVRSLEANTDSQLVIGHLTEEFSAKEGNMKKYRDLVQKLVSSFESCQVTKVPRVDNGKADLLAKLASSEEEVPRAISVQYLAARTIECRPPEELMALDDEPCWIDPLQNYLTNGVLPEDPKEARRVIMRSARYGLVEGQLYKTSCTLPLLRCLRPSEAEYVLRETHEGIAGDHIGGRALAHKVLRQGYYWPTLAKDAVAFARKCDACQRHANVPRRPAVSLTTIVSARPFALWGVDILGPFPMATRQIKFLVVAIDYFTKWVEAEPLASITEKACQAFLWKSVVCRFGIPVAFITDNGRQFDNTAFKAFCAGLGIEARLTSVTHPQANGQVEVTNRTLLHGLRTRVERSGAAWAEEIPSVLWAYRTTVRTPTGETPFALAFGVEAVLPAEVAVPTPRVQGFSAESNEERLRHELDLLEEKRDCASIKAAAYRQKMKKFYNARVRAVAFQAGDLVLRENIFQGNKSRTGKLTSNWEGPYIVQSVIRPGTYRLARMDGQSLKRPFHVEHLRKYYQ